MKIRTYLAVQRIGTVVLQLAYAGMMTTVALAPGQPFKWLTTHPADTLVLLLGPFYVGAYLNQLLHGLLHRPSAFTLPHLRRFVLRFHLPLLVLVALGFGTASVRQGGSFSGPVATLLALAALSLTLPSEGHLRWMGSRAIGICLQVLVLLAVWADELTRSVLLARPWLTGCVSLAVVGTVFHRLLSRSNRRKRAFIEILSGLQVLNDRSAVRRLTEARMARPRRTLHWARRAPTGALPAYVQATRFEHFGGTNQQPIKLFGFTLLALIGISLGLTAMIALSTGGIGSATSLLAKAPRLIWGSVDEPLFTMMSGALIVAATLLGGQLFPFFIGGGRYPLSRAKHASVVIRQHTTLTLQWFVGVLVVAGLVGVVARLCWPLPADAPPLPPALASLLAALPATWLSKLIRFKALAASRWWLRQLGLGATALCWFTPMCFALFAGTVLSPVGLLVAGAISLGCWSLFGRTVRGYYGVADLTKHQLGFELA